MAEKMARRATVLPLIFVFVTVAAFQIVPALGPVAGAQETTSKGSGEWGAATTWSCGCVPTGAHSVKILAGHTVTVSGNGTAAKVTVEGVLKASRAAGSTLTIAGNLIVRANGVLDYGTSNSPIPAAVTARIRWILDETKYVGGATMVPLDTDVGLWAIGQGKVFTDGPDRGAWTLLTATAPAGATRIVVDSRYAAGWRVGDEIVVGPSNARLQGQPAAGGALQDERRKIVAVASPNTFALDSPLVYEHKVQDVAWADTFDHAYTERLAPPVANLTRNIIFEAADPGQHPHAMIMDEATVDLADAAFVAFGPAPKNIGKFPNGQFRPFGRYGLHFHSQKEASRSSRLDSVVVSGGAGRGLDIHDSYGLTAYDVVVYDQAHSAFEGGNQAFWLEPVLNAGGQSIPRTGANDLWMDRPLALRFGAIGQVRATGIHFGPGMGAQIFGAHAAESIGNLGAGMFWSESTPCAHGDTACRDDPNRGVRGFRLTAHSSTFAFAWWNNAKFQDDVIELLGWNSLQGIDFGAYHTRTELFHIRLIGNTFAQDAHFAMGYKATGFLLDGQNRGGMGIRVLKHQLASVADEVYENGVIRGSSTAIAFHCDVGQTNCGAESHIQLVRVRFEGDPLLSFVWHSQPGVYWRIRSQEGLLRPANFTLYRRGRAIPGGVFDAAYEAIRVDNDTAGTVAPPPMVRLLQGGGCVADEAVVPSGTISVCAETDAPTVEFYNGKDLIARVGAAGTAQVTFNMGAFPKKRAYVYAKAIGANGRVNYSRVLRVIRAAPATPKEFVEVPTKTPPAARPTPALVAAPPSPGGGTAAPGAAPQPTATPRSSGTPPPATAPIRAKTSTPASRGATSATAPRLYIVQVATVRSRDEAFRLSGVLKRAGFAPYFVPLGARFAVRIGAFRQRESALQLARKATAGGFAVVLIISP